MDKSLLQKKFRFVMIIAALALFVTILTPAYIRYGKSQGWPGVIMMWNVLFGGTKAKFELSWFAFTGYLTAIILLIICLLRKFITVQPSGDKKKKKEKVKVSAGTFVLDAICTVLSFVSLVSFILLPILITNTSQPNTYLIDRYYGWGLSYVLIYIILGVMLVSSLIVLFAESIAKIYDVKVIKVKKGNKETTVEVKTSKNNEIEVEIKEEQPEE